MKVSLAKQRAMIQKLAETKAGRKSIAASLQEPLRARRDYVSVARRAFQIAPLADGMLPYYDKDPELDAYVVVDSEADPIQQVAKGDRVLVPTFTIKTWVHSPVAALKECRYDVMTRIQEKAKSEIFRQEDRKLFALISAACPAENVTTIARSAITLDTISDAMAMIEEHDNEVANIFMNSGDYTVFRKAIKDHFFPATNEELMNKGFKGTVFGANVQTSPEVKKGEILFCAQPEYLGVLPVRLDLTVISADRTDLGEVGWTLIEEIGAGVTKGAWTVAKIAITED